MLEGFCSESFAIVLEYPQGYFEIFVGFISFKK